MGPEHNPKREVWVVGESVFTAFPTVGARLAEWRHSGQPIIRWPDNAGANLAKVRGGNPILFPFAGRTFHAENEGQWQWQNQVRPMPRHGFARGGNFTMERKDNGFTATFEPTEDDQRSYPFDYTFSVTYLFAESDFTVDLTLQNHGAAPIPWSAGHHFYFPLPAEQRSTTTLQLSAGKAWRHAPNGQLTPVGSTTDETTFQGVELIDRIHTHIKAQPIRFGPLPGDNTVSMTFEGDLASPEWAAVVAWTEAEDSPFYCVEPWMGPPNGPGHGHGLATVAPGDKGNLRVKVGITDNQ
ncbi:MAG: hypothetical protein KTR25_16535 [Myxococcales bacterium]|nr:hypothetical protein [Myxococcales bacterium]